MLRTMLKITLLHQQTEKSAICYQFKQAAPAFSKIRPITESSFSRRISPFPAHPETLAITRPLLRTLL